MRPPDRASAGDGGATEDTTILGHLIGSGAVQQNPVVPHHEIMQPPTMSVVKFEPVGVGGDLFVKGLAVLQGHATYLVTSIGGEEQRAPALTIGAWSLWMHPHQRVAGRRDDLAYLRGFRWRVRIQLLESPSLRSLVSGGAVGRLFRRWANAGDGRASHIPYHAGIPERPHSMHVLAVVPHHQVMQLPFMGMHESSLRRMFV
jgi:hypothetical protein